MFTIKFTKADEINGVKYKSGDEAKVSRSIRDAKVKAGVATNVVAEVSKPKKGK